ncbi:MAG: hypothetical protein NZ773_07765 [Dehalococcoidia bacterium]|nr:hypothetical protein [Dehalococcoidia bacterium]
MMGIAAVYGGSAQHHRSLTEPKYRRWLDRLIYLPELPDDPLDGVAALLIPERLHLGFLHRAAPRVLALLERGGTVVAFGEQPRPYLPGVRWEHRPTNFWWWREPGGRSGLVVTRPDYSLFRYLTERDVTWHFHGVLRPPAGAEVVIASEDGGAIFYDDTVSTNGRLIVTTLDPMFHFGGYFMPATERFLDGFFPWLAALLDDGPPRRAVP